MVQVQTSAVAAKVFTEQTERLTAAWRRERFSEMGARDAENLIDGVVEDLIRQMGRALGGDAGHPWTRTRGVLRVSVVRGPQSLADEFETLRRCLYDALAVIGALPGDFALVTATISDASEGATALARRVENPAAPEPRVPFGGLVVELIEPQPRPHVGRRPSPLQAVH